MADINTPTADRPYTGPDRLSALPPELRERIARLLVRPGPERYLDKTDLQAAKLSCRAMHAVMKPWLFHDMGVSMRLKHDFSSINLWKWAEPAVIDLIQREPTIRPLIKSVQVRIEPFPVKPTWSDEEFADL